MDEEDNQAAERIRQQNRRDHPFVGNGDYCEIWTGTRSVGTPETGIVTVQTVCGYPRHTHPGGSE